MGEISRPSPYPPSNRYPIPGSSINSAGLTGVGLELGSQPAHGHAQVLDIADERLAPDGGEQLAVGDNPAGMSREFRNQREPLGPRPHGKQRKRMTSATDALNHNSRVMRQLRSGAAMWARVA